MCETQVTLSANFGSSTLQDAQARGLAPSKSRYLYNAAMAAQLPHSPARVLQVRDEMEERSIEDDRRSRELVRDADLLLRGQAAAQDNPRRVGEGQVLIQEEEEKEEEEEEEEEEDGWEVKGGEDDDDGWESS